MPVNKWTEDQIGYDNESNELNDVPLPRSVKQVLRRRQGMDSILWGLIAYIGSTADSDQTRYYGSMEIWKWWTFEDFVDNELRNSNYPISLLMEFKGELDEYHGMLQRTKDFQR